LLAYLKNFIIIDTQKLEAKFMAIDSAVGSTADTYDFEKMYKIAAEYDTREDYAHSIPLLEEGRRHHHPASISLLAYSYLDGHGVPKDGEKAVALFQEAAEGGDIKAMNELIIEYIVGRSVPIDHNKVNLWRLKKVAQLRKNAEQGDVSAMPKLGKMYEDGKGVARSSEIAVQWYRKAADLGNAEGAYSLSECYARGRGVPENEEEAIRLHRKAADLGHVTANFEEGLAYHCVVFRPSQNRAAFETTSGYKVDRREARRHYLRAAHLGNRFKIIRKTFFQVPVFDPPADHEMSLPCGKPGVRAPIKI
jgi:TPR repeat protein